MARSMLLLLGFAACATAASTPDGGSGTPSDGQPGPGPGNVDAPPGATPDAPGTQLLLTVAKSGNGLGTITADVGGINCGPTCMAGYAPGTMVTLTAAAGPGDHFGGWSGGGCTGTGTCVTSISQATGEVSASFTCATAAGSFVYTGAAQSFTIGSCIANVHVEAWGSQGASGQTNGTQGGFGGYAKGDLVGTSAGQVFTVMVGGQATFNGGGAGASLNGFAANRR